MGHRTAGIEVGMGGSGAMVRERVEGCADDTLEVEVDVVGAGLFVVDEAEMGRVEMGAEEDREVRLLEVGVGVADKGRVEVCANEDREVRLREVGVDVAEKGRVEVGADGDRDVGVLKIGVDVADEFVLVQDVVGESSGKVEVEVGISRIGADVVGDGVG